MEDLSKYLDIKDRNKVAILELVFYQKLSSLFSWELPGYYLQMKMPSLQILITIN